MCSHSNRPIGRTLISLDLNEDGSYSVSFMAWEAGASDVEESTTYAGLTLPEAMVAIDSSASSFFKDPF